MKTELMKRIRRIAVIAVVVMSLLLLTACGGKSEKDAFAAFAGEWAADVSSYNGIVIHEDGSWELYKNGGLYSTGELDYHSEDDSVWISPDNNTQWSRLSIEEDGSLYAAPIGYFLPGEISLDYTPEAEEEWNENTSDDWHSSDMGSGDISEYVGLWEYVDEDVWIQIYDDGTWECLDAEGYAFQFGTASVDSTGITFSSDDIDGSLRFDRTVSGDLIENGNDGMLIPADKIESRVPYFTRNGLEINAAVDAGAYLLKNGACSYYNLGKNYTVGDCYWEVIKNYDVTHDGIREIQFDTVCYVPASSLGTFDQEFIISTCSGLYDFYTGKWFNTDNDHTEKNHTEHIDNHYVNTLEWNGQSYEVEYSYSTEAEFFVADWYMVYTVSYMVYLPEGYDGLLFVAEPEAKTYEDHMKWSDPTAEYYLTEENAVDLFFSVCD